MRPSRSRAAVLLSYKIHTGGDFEGRPTVEYATATDGTNGDVIKAEVNLTVLK